MTTRPQPIQPAVRKVKPVSNTIINPVPASAAKPTKLDPVTELQQHVTRLRKAIKIWTKSDVAFDALSNVQEGSANLPVIEMILPNRKEGTTANVSFDLARIPEPDAAAVVDTLLGASISTYEESLLEIVNASQAAYAALQKQKEL